MKVGLYQLAAHLQCPACKAIATKVLGFDVPVDAYIHMTRDGMDSLCGSHLLVDTNQTRPAMCMACGLEFLLQDGLKVPLEELAANYQESQANLPKKIKVDDPCRS